MQNTSPEPPARPRIPLGIRLVLFASLALNLVVVGLVAGFLFSGGPGDRPPRHIRDAVAPYTAALSEAARREIGRNLFRKGRDGSRDERAQMRADYAEALQLLRADPFDRSAFQAVLQRQNRRASERQLRGQTALVDHVEAMSAADRESYAARVEEALKRFGRKKRR